MTAIDFMNTVNTVTLELNKNVIITDIDNSITEVMHSTSLTDEERDRLYNQFLQSKMQLLGSAFELAKLLHPYEDGTTPLELQNTIIQEQLKLAKFNTLKELAAIKKQFGYANATTEMLGDSTGDGLFDKQIEGFDKDMQYKIIKTFSENSAMLAQADQATPAWMVDSMKLLAEMMTSGKLNIVTTTTGTVVELNNNAEEPNGLGE